ncbi:dolichol-phosphate mannosyltransferase [Neorhodopirellula lusitana]|uniref:Dolichol-phosphate mannosyltransferase n=1 Tax=Neorhodopirellula lusitana TaxID=445327 RepID=A0ABY1QAA2_9BACT|nr:glycosyltransferase [Neorhodopirellula lusitana]SMP65468.1 dolichol-phosphate mannosyltransferase [Neorhodopirellula lusitana]
MHPPKSDTTDSAPSLSLILPAWNEAEVIATAIAEANAALQQVTGEYEIIVVDDGSTDATAAIVSSLAGQNEHVRLVQHSPNQGYGAAIRSGFAEAQNDLVVFTDADCQFDLTELDRFVLLAKRYEIVCGYRIDRKDNALRCLYSKVYNLLVRALLGTGVRDVDCALKMFHRDIAKQITIKHSGFLVNSEILIQARRLGCQTVEVGVSHRPRTLGESTVSVRHIPKVLVNLTRFWWNEVLFSNAKICNQSNSTGNSIVAGSCRSGMRMSLLQCGLLVVAALFLMTNLNYPLIDRDETRYAEIPREMIATGNWVLPTLNFHTYYDKPPLVYWLCALSYKCFGMSEAAARFVPSLAALSTILSTLFFGSRIFNRKIGLIAGTVLLLSVGFAFTSRYLLLDGVLSLFVSLALFTAYEAIRQPRLRLGWWIMSGICIGLAFLTKGPVALVLWLPPIAAMSWLSQGHAKVRWWHYGVVGSVATAIALPWFVAVHQQAPRFLVEFFYHHNVARFAGEFHHRPFWYFVPVLLIAGHPWSFLTIPYARFLFGRSEECRRQRPPVIGFLLLWSAWCFAFFSMSQCKLPTYLLPTAPALALMIGHYLNEVLNNSDNSERHFFARFWSARTATATTCLAGVGFAVFVIMTASQASLSVYAWAMLWTSLLVTSLLLVGNRYQAKMAWASTIGVSFLFAVMMMHQMIPAYSRSQTLFGETSPLADKLAIGDWKSIATIDHEFSEVPFYLNRPDIANFLDVHDAGLTHFVSQSGRCLLVVDNQITRQQLSEQMPIGTKMTSLTQRGPAQIYEVTAPPHHPQIATRGERSR